MKKLILERCDRFFDDESNKRILFTPPIDHDFWKYRVRLFEDQAIVGFPKFTSIGIGFAIEEDWNTNLPSSCDAEEILKHIWHNRRYVAIKKKRALKAIEMIKQAVLEDK